MERPNILYFIVHDSGRYFGCYGRPITASPNIDQFAAEGVNFTNAFCSSPACGPSRSCAMTGKVAHRHRMLGTCGRWALPPEEQTLVDYFGGGGYQTAHFGFTHERHYGEMRYEIDGEQGTEKEHYWDDSAIDVVDHAIAFLKEWRDPKRPFYLHCATGENHLAHFYTRLALHGGLFPRDQVFVPPNSPDVRGIYFDRPLTEYDKRWFKQPRTGCGQVDLSDFVMPDPPSPLTVRDLFACFYASVRYVDQHFARLLQALDALGLRDNTLIVFTTDHGIEHNRSKGTVYDSGVEIAFALQPPRKWGLRRGYAVNELIPNIDFTPTFLEGAGLPIPEGIDGRSFWPLLAGRSYEPRREIFVERNFHGEPAMTHLQTPITNDSVDRYDPVRAVRTKDFHYIRNFMPEKRPRALYRHEITGFRCAPWGRTGLFWEPVPNEPRPAEELYHVALDPTEQMNVADRPEYAAIKARLAAQLAAWMRETDDFVLRGEVPKPAFEQKSQPIV